MSPIWRVALIRGNTEHNNREGAKVTDDNQSSLDSRLNFCLYIGQKKKNRPGVKASCVQVNS